MRVTGTTYLPMLVPADADLYGDPAGPVLDAFMTDLNVAYSPGPPWGDRLVTWRDLDELGLTRHTLRLAAARDLDDLLGDVRVHGQPPVLMLSFGGMESSLLLADGFWDGLAAAVPGELVVAAPARDVVILTGSASRPGMAKVRRAVDRVLFAGDSHLLTDELLVWRRGGWEIFRAETRIPQQRPRSA